MKAKAKPHTLSSHTIRHTNQNLLKRVSSPTLQTKIADEITEGQHTTAVWRNGGCSASYDSFVVGSSAVLRLNFCAKIRHYAKPQTVSENALRHGCCRAVPFSTPLFSLMPQRVGPMGFIPPPKGTSANTRINPISPKTFPFLSKFTNFDETAVYPLRHYLQP
jgi:hypothetical protein